MKEESAGGIVFRQVKSAWEILLIQDRYGYWTFPKGKKEQGETDEKTALREIAEETQISGNIIKRLDTTTYVYQHPEHGNIQKKVTYFLVQAESGTAKPQEEEIDDVKWISLDQADLFLKQYGYQNNQHVFQLTKRELRDRAS